jgi:hypothetical protein
VRAARGPCEIIVGRDAEQIVSHVWQLREGLHLLSIEAKGPCGMAQLKLALYGDGLFLARLKLRP